VIGGGEGVAIVEAEKVSRQWVVEMFALRCQRESILSSIAWNLLANDKGFRQQANLVTVANIQLLFSFCQPILWI
jgi:hypothetical protein